MQRGYRQGIARSQVGVGAGVQEQAREVGVGEEAGEAQAGEAVAGMAVGESRVESDELGGARRVAERAGFEEVGRACGEQNGSEVGVARVDGPQDGRGAFRRPRVGERGVGGKQSADLVGIALSNGIEEHDSVSAESQRASYRILRNCSDEPRP